MNKHTIIYAVSIDGNHEACYETELEAMKRVIELHLDGNRYAEYSEDSYFSRCDCKNQNLSDGYTEGTES